MLQFLQPTLNMLLRMIGDGGETLQVGGAHCGALSIVLRELILYFIFRTPVAQYLVVCALTTALFTSQLSVRLLLFGPWSTS